MSTAATARVRNFVRIAFSFFLLTFSFSLLTLSGFFFENARASQNITERVVSFVARVFVHLVVGRRPVVPAGPRLGPRMRVIDGKPVEEVLLVEARNALDHVEILARSP